MSFVFTEYSQGYPTILHTTVFLAKESCFSKITFKGKLKI